MRPNASVSQDYQSGSYPSERADASDVLLSYRQNPSDQMLNDRTVHKPPDWLTVRNNIVMHSKYHYNLRKVLRVQRLPAPDQVNAYEFH